MWITLSTSSGYRMGLQDSTWGICMRSALLLPEHPQPLEDSEQLVCHELVLVPLLQHRLHVVLQGGVVHHLRVPDEQLVHVYRRLRVLPHPHLQLVSDVVAELRGMQHHPPSQCAAGVWHAVGLRAVRQQRNQARLHDDHRNVGVCAKAQRPDRLAHAAAAQRGQPGLLELVFHQTHVQQPLDAVPHLLVLFQVYCRDELCQPLQQHQAQAALLPAHHAHQLAAVLMDHLPPGQREAADEQRRLQLAQRLHR
mmetsp:Transcript_10569/g.22704  ORF Transcript_10569/g.22704 Transcript_10569/m.22704 type:complete len:252 (+) Transcript_10569:1732-2487(+)